MNYDEWKLASPDEGCDSEPDYDAIYDERREYDYLIKVQAFKKCLESMIFEKFEEHTSRQEADFLIQLARFNGLFELEEEMKRRLL